MRKPAQRSAHTACTHSSLCFIPCLQLLGMNVADSRKSCTKDGKWDAPTARAIG